MKKLVGGLLLGFAAFTVQASQIDEMNENMESLLSSFQNPMTKVVLQFNQLKQSAKKVENVSLNSKFSKKGSNKKVALVVNNLAYDYLKGEKPTVRFDLALNLDFNSLKNKDRKQIDEILDDIDGTIRELFDEYTGGKYGKSATFQSEILSKQRDNDGHYSHINGLVSLNVDLEKLPKQTPVEEIETTSIVFSFAIDAKEGFSLQGYVHSNPKYYYFKEIEQDLKEYLKKISDNNAGVMRDLYDYVQIIDGLLSELV
jgi:hypothetical protein